MRLRKGRKGNSKANAISDRSGFKFPMSEMVIEPGTGWLVHRSESDGRWNPIDHPLNNVEKYIKHKNGDPFPVENARPEVYIDARIKYNGKASSRMSLNLEHIPNLAFMQMNFRVEATPLKGSKGNPEEMSVAFSMSADSTKVSYGLASLEMSVEVDSTAVRTLVASASSSFGIEVSSTSSKETTGSVSSLPMNFSTSVFGFEFIRGAASSEVSFDVSASAARLTSGSSSINTSMDVSAKHSSSTPFVFADQVYSGDSIDISSVIGTTADRGFQISSDGLKCFFLSTSVVYEVDLSSAWDVTTATYNGVSHTLTNLPGSAFCFTLDSTGTYILVMDISANGVALTLSTANDLSTASEGSSVSYAPYLTASPYGAHIDLSGSTYLYIVQSDRDVKEIIAEDTFDTGETAGSMTDVFVSPDGSKMWVQHSDGAVENIIEYDLSTSFDITSASLVSETDVASVAGDVRGFCFASDGETSYVLDDNTDTVYKYELG